MRLKRRVEEPGVSEAEPEVRAGTIRPLLVGWLLLLCDVMLAQHLEYSQPAYWMLWPVVLMAPIVAGLVLWLK